MAKLYKIGGTKPKDEQAHKQKGVRFDLTQLIEQNELQQPVLSGVQERYVGFFELPERCVPFEPVPLNNANADNGFPAVVDLTEDLSKKVIEDDKETTTTTTTQKKKKSLFAQHFDKLSQKQNQNNDEQRREHSTEAPNIIPAVDETIKNLEVMRMEQKEEADVQQQQTTSQPKIGGDSRYAMDNVNFDFEVKCLRNLLARQEQQFVKLFDTMASTPSSSTSSCLLDRILSEAKQSIEQIRSLYLEQMLDETTGRLSWRFARQFGDPFSDGAWTLNPIRRVLDAVQKRNPSHVTSDDVDIVRLALLWTVLLAHERPSLFRASINVSNFYCRMAEIYLIGPKVFSLDFQMRDAITFILDEFLLDACSKGLLELRLHQPIVGLNAFMPFYEDLLGRFEEFSCIDDNFALLLLIGAYMNSAPLDGLLMAQTLWSPRREVVRQMTLSEKTAARLLVYLADEHRLDSSSAPSPASHELFAERAKLALHYAISLRDGTIMKERNPAMFALASTELRHYVQQIKIELSENQSEAQQLVDQIRRLISGKINI